MQYCSATIGHLLLQCEINVLLNIYLTEFDIFK